MMHQKSNPGKMPGHNDKDMSPGSMPSGKGKTANHHVGNLGNWSGSKGPGKARKGAKC
jgi:hypothetical protein